MWKNAYLKTGILSVSTPPPAKKIEKKIRAAFHLEVADGVYYPAVWLSLARNTDGH